MLFHPVHFWQCTKQLESWISVWIYREVNNTYKNGAEEKASNEEVISGAIDHES